MRKIDEGGVSIYSKNKSVSADNPVFAHSSSGEGGALFAETIACVPANGLYNSWFKRPLDFAFSLLLLILLTPVFAIIAVAIKLDGGGHVFYVQKRCGLGGARFKMFKFRTMMKKSGAFKKRLANEVDGPMFKIKHDPRITRVGKFLRKTSLDELPQLFNVLMGDMSLVGPRPLAVAEMRNNPGWKATRLSVKPGITGLWQVTARNSKKFSDWVEYDTAYVRHRSFMLDMRILIMTAIVLTRSKCSGQ